MTNSAPPSPAAAQLSLERRRRRNREAMQRLRGRQQRALTQLRLTADELAATHEKMLRQIGERQLSCPLNSELAWPLPSMQLHGAKEQAQALLESNQQLQRAVDERVRSEDHVALLLEYLNIESENPSEAAEKPKRFPFETLDFVSAPRLTEERAMELMLFHHRKRKALKKQWLVAKRSLFTSDFFGWGIRFFPQGRYWHLEFTKTFPNASVQQVSQRAWSNAQRLVSYRTRVPYQRFVQRINDNSFVIARWLGERDRNPQSTNVVYLLRFRVEEPDGTVGIGMQTLPQPGEDAADVLEDKPLSGSEDVCLYIKMKPVKNCATGEEHCTAEFSGRVEFGGADYAQLNALEFVISLARWEEVNVATQPVRLEW